MIPPRGWVVKNWEIAYYPKWLLSCDIQGGLDTAFSVGASVIFGRSPRYQLHQPSACTAAQSSQANELRDAGIACAEIGPVMSSCRAPALVANVSYGENGWFVRSHSTYGTTGTIFDDNISR